MNLSVVRYSVRIRAWAIAQCSTGLRITAARGGAITRAARSGIRRCIKKSGSLLTGQSRKAATSTTLIAIQTTMRSIISCVSRKRSTSRYTLRTVLRRTCTANDADARIRHLTNVGLVASVPTHARQQRDGLPAWMTLRDSALGAVRSSRSIDTSQPPIAQRSALSGTGLSTARLGVSR